MYGRNSQYIGGDEARALVGAWQSIIGANPQFDILGADVAMRQYGQQPYGQQPYARPYAQPQPYAQRAPVGYPPNQHFVWDQRTSSFRPVNPWAGWGGPPTSVRDHRRAALAHRWVSGDPTVSGALALMGAEDAAAAATGAPPPDAMQPAAPLPPAAATAAQAAAPAVPPTPGAPPLPPGPAAQGPIAAPALPPAPVAVPVPVPVPAQQAPQQADHPGHPEHRRRQRQRAEGGYGYGGGWGAHGFPMPFGSFGQPMVPYAIPPRNMLIEDPGPSRADRILLPMSSGVNILPNTSAQITSRPQNVAFRPERIIIGGDAGAWIVNDIKVGNRSQFSQSGDVPGETFASTAIDSFVSFETVQTAMDFVMLVTFIGASESGAAFVCSVLGTAAV